MGFFTSLLSKKRKVAQVASSVEFNNSACNCIQQELDISETVWIDKTPYENAKEALKAKSREIMIERYKSDNQRDFFN